MLLFAYSFAYFLLPVVKNNDLSKQNIDGDYEATSKHRYPKLVGLNRRLRMGFVGSDSEAV